MMPKRSLHSSTKIKKIKLSREFSRDSDSASSKTNQHNLKAASSLQTIIPEKSLKMTVDHAEKNEKDIKVQYLDTPVKSESDKKEYRYVYELINWLNECKQMFHFDMLL